MTTATATSKSYGVALPVVAVSAVIGAGAIAYNYFPSVNSSNTVSGATYTSTPMASAGVANSIAVPNSDTSSAANSTTTVANSASQFAVKSMQDRLTESNSALHACQKEAATKQGLGYSSGSDYLPTTMQALQAAFKDSMLSYASCEVSLTTIRSSFNSSLNQLHDLEARLQVTASQLNACLVQVHGPHIPQWGVPAFPAPASIPEIKASMVKGVENLKELQIRTLNCRAEQSAAAYQGVPAASTQNRAPSSGATYGVQ